MLFIVLYLHINKPLNQSRLRLERNRRKRSERKRWRKRQEESMRETKKTGSESRLQESRLPKSVKSQIISIIAASCTWNNLRCTSTARKFIGEPSEAGRQISPEMHQNPLRQSLRQRQTMSLNLFPVMWEHLIQSFLLDRNRDSHLAPMEADEQIII